MRSALLLVCLLAGCAGAGAQKSVVNAPDPREQYAALEARTVKLDVKCADGSEGWGSGVWLESNLIATAAHVVVRDDGCPVTWEGRAVTVLAAHKEQDVALLRVQGKRAFTPLPMETGYRGQFVVVVGYPNQYKGGKPALAVSPGFISVDFGDRYRVTSPSTFGNSGGPVFTPDGKLLGIWVELHTVGDYPIDGAYYASPAKFVSALQATL